MTDGCDRWHELDSLLDRVLDGLHNDEDAVRLNEILRSEGEACRYSINYVQLHAQLAWGDAVRCEEDGPHHAAVLPSLALPVLPCPAVIPPSHVSVFSAGLVAAYGVTAMMLAVALCAGWLWRARCDEDIASAPLQVVSTVATASSVIIGRVTGVRECQWATSKAAVREADLVSGCRRFVLKAGFLEITYNTGARVVLQGPVDYAADGYNGGSLYSGRVAVHAARIGRAELEAGEKARNHPAPPSRVVAFCVRTPTATLLDNGDRDTEFGVEVDKYGAAFTRVYRGAVVFKVPGCPSYCLEKDYCGWTRGTAQSGALIFRTGKEPVSFVLEMPKPVPVCATKQAAKESGQKSDGGS